jgi:hypothetical protein
VGQDLCPAGRFLTGLLVAEQTIQRAPMKSALQLEKLPH